MGRGGIGLATSADGIHWTRANNGEPVLTLGGADSLDDGQVMGPEVLFGGQTYSMWYTGYRREADGVGGLALRIGLAQAPLAAIEQPERGPRARALLRLWINPTGGEL